MHLHIRKLYYLDDHLSYLEYDLEYDLMDKKLLCFLFLNHQYNQQLHFHQQQHFLR